MMMAPSLQAIAASVDSQAKSAAYYHDHSSHTHDDGSGASFSNDSGFSYIKASDSGVVVPDRNIEKVNFDWNTFLLPDVFSLRSLQEARGPPDRPPWDNADVTAGQPSLILTTARFRI